MPHTPDRSQRSWRLEIPFDGVPRGRRGSALASALRRKIREGTLPAGTRLPASRVLADDLGVSRGLVVRTYEQLTAEGFLDARQGRWTEVAEVLHEDAGQVRTIEHRSTNPGLPSGEHFPRRAWARSAMRAVDQLSDLEWSYGDPAGLPALRRALSSYLGRVRGTTAPAGSIVIVNGFAQGSRLLVEALRSRGVHRIGIEDPGSIGLRDQLQRAGADCVPITVDEHGSASMTSRVREWPPWWSRQRTSSRRAW